MRARFAAGARAGAPFAVVALLVGATFGVLAEPVLGFAATLTFSTIVFAGSSQFAAIAVLGAGGGVGAAVLAGILLNTRYVPMGISLAPSLPRRWGPLRRAAVGQGMIDFSWALAMRAGGRFDPVFMLGATLPSYPAWIAGTAIGLLGGGAIGDPDALGLDAVLPAVFLALLVGGESSAPRALPAAILGAAIALAVLPFTPAGVPIIAACAAALIGWRRR